MVFTPALRRVLLAATITAVATTVFAQAVTPPTAAQIAAAATPPKNATWWKHALIYELYPRSFQDSNGDGIGDLNGITQRLDYLQHLGVDAVWIAPMYPSPQVDFGYDISNYETVDPQYGTLADFDRLLAAAKQRNILIVLDMVLNHTSDKHEWFMESARSRTNPRADWYVWNEGVAADSAGVTDFQRRFVMQSAHGKVVPPNNWESLFGGSAWEWVPARQQFYYHKFYKQQPDLNWRNPAVEKAMFATMRFWLDRGVSGFRLDAVPTLYEDTQLRNEPVAQSGLNAQGDPFLDDIYTNMLPEVHDVLRRMRTMADSYTGHRVLIGETYLPNSAELLKWYGDPAHPELQLPMDMLLGFHAEGNGPNGPDFRLSATHFRQYITEAETELNSDQPLFVFSNHDNPRSWDRFGDGVHDAAIARIIATVLLTTRSTAMTYYGEELGMKTQTPSRAEDVRDPIGITGWPKEKGRDGERTPMQWSAAAQAGFSTNTKTWLPVEPDYATVNVATESADPSSLLNWWRTLIAIRRENPTMHDGGIVMLDNSNAAVLSYVRTVAPGGRPLVIAVNMTAQPQTIHLDLSAAGIHGNKVKTLLADAGELSAITTLSTVTLPPYASIIAEVQEAQ